MSTAFLDDPLVLRARAAADAIAPLAARIESERRLPPEAVSALVDAGVFKLLVPRELGGSEASVGVLLSAIEEVARADGSAGWITMIVASSALMSVFVDDETAREVYAPADAMTCGVFAPLGRAMRIDGGFRVTGRWPFASGCELSAWRMGGAIVEGDPALPSGAPNVMNMLFRADETRVIDTWDVSGLRGTGSHDLEVKDVFVPSGRAFSFISDKPKNPAPLYRLPVFGMLAASIAAVTLGIARGALDTIQGLAKAKQPLGARRTIAHRELVQLQIAQAEAKVRAARAFLHAAMDDAVREGEDTGETSLEKRALIRAAASHAASESALAVDLAYNAGGATSIYARSPLQRHFRDVHAATQHVMVSPVAATLAGRVLLGVESDTSTL